MTAYFAHCQNRVVTTKPRAWRTASIEGKANRTQKAEHTKGQEMRKHLKTDTEATKEAYETLRAQNPWSHRSSKLLHHRVLPHATLAPWLNDPAFLNIYNRVVQYTLVDLYRCYELWTLAQQASKVDGAILEVGVWRGGTGAILAEANRLTKKAFILRTHLRV